MKNSIVHILLALFTATSCNMLDVELQDNILLADYYDTEEKLQTALRGVYATLAESDLYGNNMLGRMGLECDEGYENYNIDRQTVGYYVVSAADVKILGYWKALYAGIHRASELLNNINKPNMDETKRNNIRGEALFLRAYCYFMLVNKFGDVPLILEFTPANKAENLQIPRTDSKTVYTQIIKDMEEAAKSVYNASSYTGGGHISKSAVWGILARVCLHAAGNPLNMNGMYDKAAVYADSVIKTGFHSLNPSYKQIFINYAQDMYDIRESIWEVEFWGNNTTSYATVAGMVGRNNGIRNNNTTDTIGYSIGAIKRTDVLYNLYEYTEQRKDLRRDWNIALYFYRKDENDPDKSNKINATGSFDGYAAKFRRENEKLLPKNSLSTPTNFPLLRYADVLLMYAEAVFQKTSPSQDEIDKAYTCINEVRRRAFVASDDTYDIKSTDYNDTEDLLTFIQEERARELCYETLRKTDLVRWGIFYETMKYVESQIPGASGTGPDAARIIYGNVTARDVIWPVPSHELGLNKLLIQNPGW
jgi:hypothetical protein